jgi:hypothetical protein
MASAALMVGSVVTTGGLTALVVKIFHSKKSAKAFGLKNLTQRRNDHGYGDEQEGSSESRAAG